MGSVAGCLTWIEVQGPGLHLRQWYIAVTHDPRGIGASQATPAVAEAAPQRAVQEFFYLSGAAGRASHARAMPRPRTDDPQRTDR